MATWCWPNANGLRSNLFYQLSLSESNWRLDRLVLPLCTCNQGLATAGSAGLDSFRLQFLHGIRNPCPPWCWYWNEIETNCDTPNSSSSLIFPSADATFNARFQFRFSSFHPEFNPSYFVLRPSLTSYPTSPPPLLTSTSLSEDYPSLLIISYGSLLSISSLWS